LAKRGKALFKSVCLGKCKSRDLPKRLNLTGIAPEMNQITALVRTEFTPNIVDDEEIEEAAQNFLNIYIHTLSLQQAVLKMNVALCKRYGLGFYLGNSAAYLRLRSKP